MMGCTGRPEHSSAHKMTIRLMTLIRRPYWKVCLDMLAESGAVKSVLDLGGGLGEGISNAAHDLPAIIRQKAESGSRSRLLAQAGHDGSDSPLLVSEAFQASVESFRNQVHCNAGLLRRNSQESVTMHESMDYFHIVSDAIAQAIDESQITHALFFEFPRYGLDHLVYDVARLMGVKTLVLSSANYFANMFCSTDSIDDYGQCELDGSGLEPYPPSVGDAKNIEGTGEAGNVESAELDGILGAIQQEQASMEGSLAFGGMRLLLHLLRYYPFRFLNLRYCRDLFKGLNATTGRMSDWRSPYAKLFEHDQLAYLEYILQYERNPIDLDKPYIYVPLQCETELTTTSIETRYRDQLLMIEQLHGQLPDGWRILVKPDFSGSSHFMSPMFFHRLHRLPSVQLASSLNSRELVNKARLVATVSDPTGWEAVRAGVPVLVFGAAWYSSLPGVMAYRPDIDIEQLAGQLVSREKIAHCAALLFSRFHAGAIDESRFHLIENFDSNANTREVSGLIHGLLTGELMPSFQS